MELSADDPTINGVFLSSPWISFSNSAASWKRNADKDILTEALLRRATAAFVNPGEEDGYNEPFGVEAKWWAHIPARVVKIWYGGYEVIADDVREFGKRLKVSLFHAIMSVGGGSKRGLHQRNSGGEFER